MTSRWLAFSLFALSCARQGSTASASQTVATAPAPMPMGVGGSGGVDQGPNPFEGAAFYLNPDYLAKVEAAAAADQGNMALLKQVAKYPTAIWLDSVASVVQVQRVLALADKQQTDSGKPVVTVFVVYNLPNRDCSAKASAGELEVDRGGEAKYKAEFIDRIAAEFAAHPRQRIVAIIEPDSLANLATNMSIAKCAAADRVYRSSIAYAISRLSMPHTSLYLDAAHAGWLGWEGNYQKIAQIFKDVLQQAGGNQKVRGFATNVSNYNTISGGDGRTLGASNPCPDEGSYIVRLTKALEGEGIRSKQFIIDTARNGRVVRSTWATWCNVRGAAIGPRPQSSPMPLVDAFYWVKPPGESDGTSDPKAARFDQGCASPESMPNAPEAGQWFGAHLLDMAKNANPPL